MPIETGLIQVCLKIHLKSGVTVLAAYLYPERIKLHSVDSSIAAADLIFISLGSNDLCDANYPPHKFARDIVSYANYLKCGLEIKQVVIGQILFRDRQPYELYNDHVAQANVQIQSLCETEAESGLYFWKHRGMWNVEHRIWAQTVSIYHVIPQIFTKYKGLCNSWQFVMVIFNNYISDTLPQLVFSVKQQPTFAGDADGCYQLILAVAKC